MRLEAGDVLFIPAGTIHAAKNVGSGTAAELATYIVEKGKPLLTEVPVTAPPPCTGNTPGSAPPASRAATSSGPGLRG